MAKEKPKALYIDDDKLQRAYYVEGLRDEGFDVAEAESTKDAMEKIDAEYYDVMLTDLMMPPGEVFSAEESRGGMITGWLIARRARLRKPSILIVILTADPAADEVEEWCKRQAPYALFLRKSNTLFDYLAAKVKAEYTRLNNPVLKDLINQMNRFHRAAKRLERRHDKRPGWVIDDEYDVQDLLHGILLCQYDDVRAEEWVPSYAGGGARIDFLLPEDSIAIEIKKTRSSLSTPKLAEQLIVDISRYQQHPSCKTLVCFIYDPMALIENPAGFIKDLQSLQDSRLRIEIIVSPSI